MPSDSRSVSVVIPVFNRAHIINRAVSSVLAQNSPAHEILVVDDGSSDDLATALRDFNDPRIALIRHQQNRGASAARNTGINASTGDLIAMLDSDDEWHPEKLSRQLAFMREYGFRASCTGFSLLEPNAGQPAKSAWRPYGKRLGLSELVWGCYVSPGTTLIAEKSLFQEVGAYDLEFPRYEDWDLLLKFVNQLSDEGIGYLSDSLAMIHVGHQFSVRKALAGLHRMQSLHESEICRTNRSYQRNFLAGLAFNRASIHHADRNVRAMLTNLLISVYYQPLNWALAVILSQKLR